MCLPKGHVGGSATTLTSQEEWAAQAEARLGFTGNDLKKYSRIMMERLTDGMSAEALLVEKLRVRRQLQHYDLNFVHAYNRPPTQQDRLPMKGLYKYYNSLKVNLAKELGQTTLNVSENASALPALEAPPGFTLPPGPSLPVPGLFPPGLSLPVHPPPGLCTPQERMESFGLQPNLLSTNLLGASKLTPAHLAGDIQGSDFSKADSLEEYRAPPVSSTRIDWCIDNLSQKLCRSRGGPVTSHVFEIDGMPELRLIFVPGQTWLESRPNLKLPRGCTGIKTKHGSLKLKCVGSELPASLSFFLSVGSYQMGRFKCGFAEKNVQECLFSVDWLLEAEVRGL